MVAIADSSCINRFEYDHQVIAHLRRRIRRVRRRITHRTGIVDFQEPRIRLDARCQIGGESRPAQRRHHRACRKRDSDLKTAGNRPNRRHSHKRRDTIYASRQRRRRYGCHPKTDISIGERDDSEAFRADVQTRLLLQQPAGKIF